MVCGKLSEKNEFLHMHVVFRIRQDDEVYEIEPRENKIRMVNSEYRVQWIFRRETGNNSEVNDMINWLQSMSNVNKMIDCAINGNTKGRDKLCGRYLSSKNNNN